MDVWRKKMITTSQRQETSCWKKLNKSSVVSFIVPRVSLQLWDKFIRKSETKSIILDLCKGEEITDGYTYRKIWICICIVIVMRFGLEAYRNIVTCSRHPTVTRVVGTHPPVGSSALIFPERQEGWKTFSDAGWDPLDFGGKQPVGKVSRLMTEFIRY